jgi:2-(1,2-epoxy-1,2-dihydrophenyl)acetyl-CoA isomerase
VRRSTRPRRTRAAARCCWPARGAVSAPQDLNEIVGAAPSDLTRLLEHYHPLILKIRALPIPVVCAVNGVAAGAGANLALACDIVLAARSASFVQAFARIGLIPDCGGTWFLPRLVGNARARALAMLAEPLPAETAAEWGLIWRMVEDEKLAEEAQALAARLAAQASAAVALTKRALDAAGSNTLDRQLDLEGELQLEAGKSSDHAEGCAPSREASRRLCQGAKLNGVRPAA